MTWRVFLLLLIGLAILGCGQSGDSPPDVPSQPTVTTKSGVEMVLIPAGSFEMGSRHGREEEKPVQPGHIRAEQLLFNEAGDFI